VRAFVAFVQKTPADCEARNRSFVNNPLDLFLAEHDGLFAAGALCHASSASMAAMRLVIFHVGM
jgi:hypothetical protein